MQRSASTLVSTKFDTSIPSRSTSSTYAIAIQPRGNSNKAGTKSIKPAYTVSISLQNLAHGGTPLHTSENAWTVLMDHQQEFNKF